MISELMTMHMRLGVAIVGLFEQQVDGQWYLISEVGDRRAHPTDMHPCRIGTRGRCFEGTGSYGHSADRMTRLPTRCLTSDTSRKGDAIGSAVAEPIRCGGEFRRRRREGHRSFDVKQHVCFLREDRCEAGRRD